MKLDYGDKIQLAKNKYDRFARNPREYAEVLISFTDNVRLSDMNKIIKDDSVTISLFHYFLTSNQNSGSATTENYRLIVTQA